MLSNFEGSRPDEVVPKKSTRKKIQEIAEDERTIENRKRTRKKKKDIENESVVQAKPKRAVKARKDPLLDEGQ